MPTFKLSFVSNMSSTEAEDVKTCCFSYVNSHDLLTNNSSGTDRKKLLVRGFGRSHHRLVPDEIYALCFEYFNDDHINARANIIDMGFRTILRHKMVYKDWRYKSLLDEWSSETGIPTNHLAVYHYTERPDGTMRPNNHIVVDLEEEFKDDGEWSNYQIKNHLIPTNPTLDSIDSIHNRIGNLVKRSFMLLDERRITTVQSPSYWCHFRPQLVTLKYFDILEQKTYFVDWLRLRTTTIEEVAKYIENQLIPNNKCIGGPLYSLLDLQKKMTEFEEKYGNQEQPKFQFFEEETAIKGHDEADFKVRRREYDGTIGYDSLDGGIFVFQLNPFHPYFQSLESERIDDQQRRELPIYFERRKFEFEKYDDAFWYYTADQFIKSLVNMTKITIRIREGTSWDAFRGMTFTALILGHFTSAYLLNFAQTPLLNADTSHHEWIVDENTTFGMIRKRLGSQYRIKPEHIEIWIPQRAGRDPWDFGSRGRGQWDHPISELVNRRAQWRDECPLRFEIVAYNVRDFDKMTTYHTAGSSVADARIQELAMFNVSIATPTHPAMNSITGSESTMTITHRKNWTAKDLIQSILDLVAENPVLRYSFCGHILEYIRKYDNEDYDGVSDADILRRLSPNRFVIVDEWIEGKPVYFYMDDKYEMPQNYSPIKYTDMKLLLLAENDPMIEHCGQEYIKQRFKSLSVLDDVIRFFEPKRVGLWVQICSMHQSVQRFIRVVIEEEELFKEVILRKIWPYLKINELSVMISAEGNVLEKMMRTHRIQVFTIDSDMTEEPFMNHPNIAAVLNPVVFIRVRIP